MKYHINDNYLQSHDLTVKLTEITGVEKRTTLHGVVSSLLWTISVLCLVMVLFDWDTIVFLEAIGMFFGASILYYFQGEKLHIYTGSNTYKIQSSIGQLNELHASLREEIQKV